jgi:hypothetical protein
MPDNHDISLNEAIQMVTTYRQELKNILQPDYSSALPFAETFDKSVFSKLATVPGSVSVRAYAGLDDKKQVRLIFVAVNANNEDILPDEGGSLFEFGQRCPPVCGTGPLNPQV